MVIAIAEQIFELLGNGQDICDQCTKNNEFKPNPNSITGDTDSSFNLELSAHKGFKSNPFLVYSRILVHYTTYIVEVRVHKFIDIW